MIPAISLPYSYPVLTCASRLCLRSLTRHRQLLDVELHWNQPRQVPELIYKKCHGSSPAVVVHHKHCCSYFGTAAIKHETRQQSSSIIGLQLQQPTAATGSYSKGLQLPSLPLPPSPVIPRRILRDQRGRMRCGTTRGNSRDHSGRVSIDTAVCKNYAGPRPIGNDNGLHRHHGRRRLYRHRGRRTRASPS